MLRCTSKKWGLNLFTRKVRICTSWRQIRMGHHQNLLQAQANMPVKEAFLPELPIQNSGVKALWPANLAEVAFKTASVVCHSPCRRSRHWLSSVLEESVFSCCRLEQKEVPRFRVLLLEHTKHNTTRSHSIRSPPSHAHIKIFKILSRIHHPPLPGRLVLMSIMLWIYKFEVDKILQVLLL